MEPLCATPPRLQVKSSSFPTTLLYTKKCCTQRECTPPPPRELDSKEVGRGTTLAPISLETEANLHSIKVDWYNREDGARHDFSLTWLEQKEI